MVKRIIPCLDTKEGKLVKGVHFNDIKEIGDPAEAAEKYEEQGADELVFLDILATPEGKSTFLEAVEKISKRISTPFTVGGGIRSVEDARRAVEAGADKVSVNTAAVKDPELLEELSDELGSEKIVSAIDAKKQSDDEWEVHISGGREPTGTDMIDWAETVEEKGAGEILYTGLHTDGTKEGYDLKGTRALSEVVDIPIKEEDIAVERLLNADEAFFTGTAAEVVPIREIDEAIIGNGKRGEITEQLQSIFLDVVSGKRSEYRSWLDIVKWEA